MMNTAAKTDDLRAELQVSLQREEGSRKWLLRGAWLLLLSVLLGVGFMVRAKNRPPAPAKYLMATVSKGDVIEKVQATGAVQPLLQVNVGSQVNGRVTRVNVDFNSLVKKGDILAEIDPTIYGAQVSQGQATLLAQRAQVDSTKANAEAARLNVERVQKLNAQGLASQGELDQARGQFSATTAQVSAAQAQGNAIAAQLVASQSNVGFTKLYAPVDGMVISRAIDPGATVVASFQTSTLFVIAQDLKRMRILADVDEADVGKLRAGMTADATVDAFPGESFRGTVQQVRFSPSSVQGVVTYAAVVEVSNPEEKLRPGMTATVTVRTNETLAQIQVPNAALRYKPTPPASEGAKPDSKPVTTPEAPLAKGKGRVFVVTSDKPGEEKTEPRILSISVTDGVHTVITDGIKEGEKVVTDETDESDSKKKKGKMF
jgi:HlyD family secretion protein